MKFWHKSRAILLVQMWKKTRIVRKSDYSPASHAVKWPSPKDIEQKQTSDINQWS